MIRSPSSPILLLVPQLLALPGSGHQLLIGDILGLLRNWMFLCCFFLNFGFHGRFSLNDFMVLICINELCPAQVIRLWSFLDLLDVAQWPPWRPHSSGSSQWEKKAHHLTDKKYPAWSTFTSRTGKIHHVSWEDSRTKW